MSSSRDTNNNLRQINIERQLDIIEDYEQLGPFETLDEAPPPLPSRSKPLEDLEFPNQAEEDANKPQSAHRTNTAYRTNSKGEKKLYYFKWHKNGSPVSPLEALCTEEARYLAGEDVIPSVHGVYHGNGLYRFCGVRSKAIPNFQSNYKAPLTNADTQIDFLKQNAENDPQIAGEYRQLLQHINSVLNCYTSTPATTWSSNLFQSAINTYNAYSNPNSKAAIIDPLTTFQTNHQKFDLEAILGLLKIVKGRREFILNDPKHQIDPRLLKVETDALGNTINVAENLLMMSLKPVMQLQRVYQNLKSKGVCFENFSDEELFYECGYKITARDLKNFIRVKKISKMLVARYLLKDTDGHNNNMSTKEPWAIDWDMAKLPIMFQFRESSQSDYWFRKPYESDFRVTARDIAQFPNLVDAKFHYWPTQATIGPKSSDTISYFYKIPENFFKSEHVKAFKELENNPVFVFFKYQSFMKFILTHLNTYQSIFELNYQDSKSIPNHRDTNLLKVLYQSQKQRIDEISNVLVTMPEFKKYLSYHGEDAFQITLEEMHRYKTKYEVKVKARELIVSEELKKKKTDYRSLVASLKLDVVKQKFEHLKAYIFNPPTNKPNNPNVIMIRRP